jgi:hypothetical protein
MRVSPDKLIFEGRYIELPSAILYLSVFGGGSRTWEPRILVILALGAGDQK